MSVLIDVVGEVAEITDTGIGAWVQSKIERASSLITDVSSNILDIAKSMFSSGLEAMLDAGVRAGMQWLISLLAPGGAIVRVVMALYDLVKWIAANAARIEQLLKTIIDAVRAAFTRDGVPMIADKIETSLASFLTTIISALASIFGAGNVPNQVKSAITRLKDLVTAPVHKVLTWLGQKLAGLWNALLTRLGLADTKESIILADRWGENNANKLWSPPDGQIMLEASPKQRVRSYLTDLKQKDPNRKCLDDALNTLTDLEKITQSVSTRAKSGASRADVKPTTAERDQAKSLQAQLASQLNGCLGGAHACTDATTQTVSELRDGRAYTAKIDALPPIRSNAPRRVCRVHEINGPIENSPSGNADNPRDQMRDLLLKDTPFQKTYQAGHLIAGSLGGLNKRENLVPMHEELNNKKPRVWREMEIWVGCCLPNPPITLGCPDDRAPDCRKVTKGSMFVTAIYPSTATGTKRYIPTRFDVTVQFATADPNLTATHKFYFNNVPPIVDNWAIQKPKACVP